MTKDHFICCMSTISTREKEMFYKVLHNLEVQDGYLFNIQHLTLWRDLEHSKMRDLETTTPESLLDWIKRHYGTSVRSI